MATESRISTSDSESMEHKERDSFSARIRPAVRSGTSSRSSSTQTRIVDFRSGEAVHCHPELTSFLREGWTIRSAAPCIVESGIVRLLVVMEQHAATT